MLGSNWCRGLCLFWLVLGCPVSAADTVQPVVVEAASVPALAGSPSIDVLLDRFLAALEKRDRAGLHRLRVSEEEYLGLIVPYTVEPGQPPREVSARPKQYFWQVLDEKSRLFGDVLLERFGGRHFVERKLRFTEQPRKYAGYAAYGEVRLDLKDETGAVYHLSTGWIAETSGQYEFIGFEWDD